MAYIQQEEESERSSRPRRIKSLADRVRDLERKKILAERSEETVRETKQFKYPFKWRMKFNQTRRRNNEDKILVIFLNKKNQIEVPRFMPIFDGNMIV